MVNANGCCLKIYFTLFLFIPLVSFAQQRYNVVKDYGFENNDTIWVEYKSNNVLIADKHVQPGHESKYCGLTDSQYNVGNQVAVYYCYLEQKLTKRVAKDYNFDGNVRYYSKIIQKGGEPRFYDYWFISFNSLKKRLIFLYAGPSAAQIPKEDDTTHIIKMNIPPTDSWLPETLNFYEKWTEKFSENDTIEKMRLASYLYVNAGLQGQGQLVYWDDIVFESTRPDSDAAVVDVGFSGIPSAKVQNKGAVAVNFPTICDIFQGSTRVYSDTVNVDSLAVDSIKQVSFKPYSDTGEMKVYTVLPGDQNPGNDTLSKNLAIQEAVIKKPFEFKVWPTLTKDIINISSPNPIRIYNINGREVASSESGLRKLSLTAAGVYFVRSGDKIRKIVKIE
jgi:hypothetical protein